MKELRVLQAILLFWPTKSQDVEPNISSQEGNFLHIQIHMRLSHLSLACDLSMLRQDCKAMAHLSLQPLVDDQLNASIFKKIVN
jgi:hypothetical protein